MKKKLHIYRVCLAVILFSVMTSSGAYAKSPDSMLSQRKAVVTILVNDGKGSPVASGTGFLFDARGVIATSCNLVAKWIEKLDYTLVARGDDGTVFPMDDLLSRNCNNNLVLITVKGDEFPTVRLAPESMPKKGQVIYVVDRSSNREGILSGVIGSVQRKDGIFQVTAPFRLEREGSPVFNAKGEVIGLWTLPPGKRQGRPVVVPLKYLEKERGKYKAFIRQAPTVRSAPAALPPPVMIPEAPSPPVQRTAEEEFQRAGNYERANMYKEAMAAYGRAIEMKPDYGEAYMNLGLLYYKLGRYSEAVDAYTHVVRIKPDTRPVYNKLGATYILLGKYEMALDSFKRSLKLDPRNPETHFSLGVAYVITGDRDGAAGEYLILKGLDRARAEKLLELLQ